MTPRAASAPSSSGADSRVVPGFVTRCIHVVAAISVFAPSAAHAQTRTGEHTASLSLHIAANVTGCPPDTAWSEAVTTRLGYDPFRTEASEHVDVEVSRLGPRLRARVRLEADGHPPTGTRTLTARRDQCDQLVAVTALAISIAIDPLSASRPPTPSAPPSPEPSSLPPSLEPAAALSSSPPPSSPSPSPSPAPPGSASPPASRPRVRSEYVVSLGGGILLGWTPSITPAAALAGEWQRSRFALGVEAEVALPQSAAYLPPAHVDVFPVLLSLMGCYRIVGLSLCGIGTAALLVGQGNGYAIDQQTVLPAFATGARVAYDLSLASWISLRARVDAQILLTSPHFDVDSATAWTAPVGVLGGGVDVRIHFR